MEKEKDMKNELNQLKLSSDNTARKDRKGMFKTHISRKITSIESRLCENMFYMAQYMIDANNDRCIIK